MRISVINDSCSRSVHADAENELSELDPKCAYIIGGIVDRNRYKGLCKTKAETGGIRTARLPIGDYMKLLAAPVMTVNHVRLLLACVGMSKPACAPIGAHVMLLAAPAIVLTMTHAGSSCVQH